MGLLWAEQVAADSGQPAPSLVSRFTVVDASQRRVKAPTSRGFLKSPFKCCWISHPAFLSFSTSVSKFKWPESIWFLSWLRLTLTHQRKVQNTPLDAFSFFLFSLSLCNSPVSWFPLSIFTKGDPTGGGAGTGTGNFAGCHCSRWYLCRYL